VIGALPVSAVDVALVMKILGPLWPRIPETASRLRGRIELILDWAKVRGYRDGENPALGAATSTSFFPDLRSFDQSGITPRSNIPN
jgi:hypothetical protein